MTHKFDKNVLDLGKRKGFYPYGFMAHDEKFKEEMPTKKMLLVPWLTEKFLTKNMIMLLMFRINLK